MHANAYYTFEKFVLPLLKDGMRVLEISPARRIYLKAITRAGITLDYHVAELGEPSSPAAVRMLDENTLEAPSDSFDAVWSSSVIEHVAEPWLWLPDQVRVVKPGGFIAVIGPFTWREHRVKVPGGRRDSWRVLPDGMRTLFSLAGLKTEVAQTTCLKRDIDWELKANRGAAIDVIAIGRKLL